jgi:cobalamin biosynthesis protein CobT
MEMEIPDATQEQEESSGDVEQSMDSDGADEDSSDSGSSEESSSTEDTEGDTEEVAEESTEEESTEESTEEESTEEESTEEESTEEESTEEESTEEESTEEKPVVKKKTTKKLTKAQKEKAKKEKMKEIIKDKLKKLADDVGKAQTLEAQQALQQIIAALINYVPGFNAYGQLAIPGIDFYNQDEIYKDKKVPENLRGLRNGLASELLHKKMVDMQYEGMD